MKPGFKIAYLTSTDPENRHSWSGTHYFIYKVLQKKFETIIAIGPYEPKFILFLGKVRSKISLLFLNKRYNYAHSKSVSRAYAKYFDDKINSLKPDIIIAPSASSEIAHLKTKIPVVYISDSTVNLSLNYHKALSKLFNFSKLESDQTEQAAINKASLVILSSEWAASSVINYYKKSANNVSVIPFGANIENVPRKINLAEKPMAPVKLLFIGTYWESKGGEYAYNCMIALLKNNINTELTVIGCLPPPEFNHPKLKVIPFINKNESDGQKQLIEFYSSSHFLILPTRFDCTPIVICEASAFGLPVLCSNTGGVAGHVKENVNGFLIDFNDTGKAFSLKIIEILNTPGKYKNICISARALYENELNWDKWSDSLEIKLKDLQLIPNR